MIRWIAGACLVGLAGLILALRLQSRTPERFVVAKGASAREIAHNLRHQGLLWHPWTFVCWVKLCGKNGIHPGYYLLSPRLTGYQIYRTFRQGPPVVRVTFPEGWSAQQMAVLLKAKEITPAEPFMVLVKQQHLEGYLFPDTYFFEQGLAPQGVLDRMVRRFHEQEPRDLKGQVKVLKLTYNQIVTLASLVEKEARVPEERSLIAGVYRNRLRRRMRLEADPTVQYALGGWKEKLNYKDLAVESPYNTYRHYGLPPGPICNPGAASLAAAAHPTRSEYLFFVADPATGRHTFSKTYQEHLVAQHVKRRVRTSVGAAK
ncbi:MAG: endolytic transglycosylase MltG [Elusimicrobiota bacterium]